MLVIMLQIGFNFSRVFSARLQTAAYLLLDENLRSLLDSFTMITRRRELNGN